MRTTRMMTSALLAAAAMMGMAGHGMPAMEYTLQPPTGSGNTLYAATLRTPRRSKGRVAQNQRQRRKDKRRAHAAGCKRAFLV